MSEGVSITRRLTITVLLLELFAGLVLIATVTNHERRVRFETFDANLRGTSNALLGSVQEADSKDGSVRLDLHGLALPPHSIYRVSADQGNVLGSRGELPQMAWVEGQISKVWIQKHPYRFYILGGERVIDPGSPQSIDHHVTVIYGLPEGRTWHEIFEATRFFAIATILLLGLTTGLLFWLIRRYLQPIHVLAQEAEKVSASSWEFRTPESSQKFFELRPLALAIETVVARLQRSFEQQRRFTSDAAHELKTDLAIVKSSVQLLQMKQRTVSEYEKGLDLTLNDLARLEETVQKMLTLARLEQLNKAEERCCDFSVVVQDSIAQSHPFAERNHILVVPKAMTEGIKVRISKEDALLLCANLLMNALQHSPMNGVVETALSCEEQTAVFTIRDFGLGVAEADLPFLFDAFYRGDFSRSRKSGGTGLGLTICKEICERAGGSIFVTNHEQGGAYVLVRLPMTRGNR